MGGKSKTRVTKSRLGGFLLPLTLAGMVILPNLLLLPKWMPHSKYGPRVKLEIRKSGTLSLAAPARVCERSSQIRKSGTLSLAAPARVCERSSQPVPVPVHRIHLESMVVIGLRHHQDAFIFESPKRDKDTEAKDGAEPGEQQAIQCGGEGGENGERKGALGESL